jgi:DNA helicase-2/ATP-dependent DNA helicase PcrA
MAARCAAVPYVAGKAGTSLNAFIKLIEGARFETQHLPLPEMVKVVLDLSGLMTHYRNEKEGADRIENLEQLVSAATLFVSEEGYGLDAPAFLGRRHRPRPARPSPPPMAWKCSMPMRRW